MRLPLFISSSQALRLGARTLKPGLVFVTLLFAARTVQAIVGVAVGPALAAAFTGAAGPTIVPAAGLVWLVAQLGASLALAFFARTAVATHGTVAGGRGHGAVSDALGFLVVGGAVSTAARLWVWTALLATGFSFVHALVTQSHGFAASFALALALVVALPLGFFASLWVRLALARAAVRDRGYLAALHELGGALSRRGGRPVWVFLLGGFAGWVLELVAAGAFAPLTPSLTAPGAGTYLLARGVVAALGTGAIAAFLECWVLGAFCALELADAQALNVEPQWAPAPPVVEALPVETATVADQPAGNGPVVDALPAPGKPDDTDR